MKRIKVIILGVLMVISFSFVWNNINASNVYPNDYYDNHSEVVKSYSDGVKFNYIIFKDDEAYYEAEEKLYDFMSGYYAEGVYDYVTYLDITTSAGRKLEGELHTKFRFKNSYVLYVDYYFNDYLYYHRNISDDGDYKEFTYYDICDYYGEYVVAEINGYYEDDEELDYESNFISYYMNNHYQFMDMGYCLYYMDNTNDEINIDFENPLDIEDIIDRVGIRNKNGVRLGDYELVSTDYDSNNVDVGVYNAKIYGIDKDHNIYFKNIHIVSSRLTNPIHLENLRVRYNEVLTRSDIIDSVSFDCEYSDLICRSDYFGNEGKCGDYEYSISIVADGNVNYLKSDIITVYDDIPPKVSGPAWVDTDTENRITYDELLEKCVVYDEYSDEGLIIDIKELNSEDNLYINNYNLSGRYKFSVIGIDQYENMSHYDFNLYVSKASDNSSNTSASTDDNKTTNITPSLSNNTTSVIESSIKIEDSKNIETSINTSTTVNQREEFKFRTTTNNKLTIEDMKRMLLDSDEITKEEFDKVSIKSSYFDNMDKAGKYDVYINDGNHEYCIEIEVSEAKEEKKEEVKEEKITTKDIIMYSSIGGLFLIIVILIIILRRKKK